MTTFGRLAPLAVGAILAGCNQRPGEAFVNGTDRGARRACEDFVRDTLKAPSTAKFGQRERPVMLDAGRWRSAGFVDAQNAFGAKIRGSYICDVRYTAGGGYQLVSLQVE